MASKMKRPEKYVVLEHLTLPDRGWRFWTTNSDDNTHGHTGELWYKEILFTDSEEEAIDMAKKHGDNIPSSGEIYDWYVKIHENKNKDEKI
jgi:hypothetical protein